MWLKILYLPNTQCILGAAMKPASLNELSARDVVYNMTEVSKHNTMSDCWVVVNGQVLNVTKFLPEHPGGEFAILAVAGKDASEEFNKIHGPDVIGDYAPDAGIVGLPSSDPSAAAGLRRQSVGSGASPATADFRRCSCPRAVQRGHSGCDRMVQCTHAGEEVPRCGQCQDCDDDQMCRCICGACDAANSRAIELTGYWTAEVGAARAQPAPVAMAGQLTRCRNPACGFMEHLTGVMGNFCCHACWKEYDSSGGDMDLLIAWGQRHGPKCQRHVAPESAPSASGCRLPHRAVVSAGSAL